MICRGVLVSNCLIQLLSRRTKQRICMHVIVLRVSPVDPLLRFTLSCSAYL